MNVFTKCATMKDQSFQIATDSAGTHVVVRLFGTRDGARSREFAQRFLSFYPAQPIRSLLVDLTQAEVPEPLFSFVERFSMVANLCPRSRVALWAADPNSPAAILLAQTVRGACHDVLLTSDREEAERFLKTRPRSEYRPCSRPLTGVPPTGAYS
jgi:hypothetical protein